MTAPDQAVDLTADLTADQAVNRDGLRISALTVDFNTDDGAVHAVRGVDLEVGSGEIVAVVGESGSGKSVTALSVLRLHPKGRTVIGGRIDWQGEDLLAASDDRIREVRGGEISMIFQDPLTALNPVYTVGRQIREMVRAHTGQTRRQAQARAVEMLGVVGIPKPATRADMYPHEFSGGMRQRAMIAMALALEPKLIIADEPTTALDVTVQAQVLDLLTERASELGSSVLLITHDLGVVAGMADRVAVMYAGLVVEDGTVDGLFAEPSHPYTVGLLNSLPRIGGNYDEELHPIGGQPPSMLRPPPGCAFHPRCPLASTEAGCRDRIPVRTEIGVGGAAHGTACWRHESSASLLIGATNP